MQKNKVIARQKWTHSEFHTSKEKKAESTHHLADFSSIPNSHGDMKHAQTPHVISVTTALSLCCQMLMDSHQHYCFYADGRLVLLSSCGFLINPV